MILRKISRLLAGILGICACTGNSSTSAASSDSGTVAADAARELRDAGPEPPDGAADARTCGVDPGASREEIALTPRVDRDAEFLALAVGTRVVAEQDTYDRVVRDLAAVRAAVRAARPDLADLHVWIPFRQMFGIGFDAASGARVSSGTYDGLNCLNAQYGGEPEVFDSSIVVHFKGLYAIDRLACRYSGAPGVTRVYDANPVLGDGSRVFAWAEGNVFHYVFDRAEGSCSAGCTAHDAVHYKTDPGGDVTFIESYTGNVDADGPPPAWVVKRYMFADCLKR